MTAREYTNKLNDILLLRTRSRVEAFHKPKGIARLLERNQKNKNSPKTNKVSRSDFNSYSKHHGKVGEDSKQIRGIFRLPTENTATGHSAINAVPYEEDEKEEKN